MAGNFDPASIPGLSNEAREAVSAFFKAMTAWQSETAKLGEKNSKQVFDKMATAASALGWPEQIVDAARTQMQTIGEMQTKTMEHIKQAWEEQLKLPNAAMASPDAFLSKFQAMPNLGAAGSFPTRTLSEQRLPRPWHFGWSLESSGSSCGLKISTA